MTIEAIKKEIATLKAQVREINAILDEWEYRLDKDAEYELLCEELHQCYTELKEYEEMLKGAEEWEEWEEWLMC